MDPIIDRTTIIAVGVSRYKDPAFPELPGPEADVARLRELLVENPHTALYKPAQFIELIDPTSSDLRRTLIDYSLSRTALGDILIFYFSGHGVPVGYEDFGFCTSDTQIHPVSGSVEPLSVVKYSDLLKTIAVANAIPVVIIDSCYSGMASFVSAIPPIEVIDAIQAKTTTQAASKYALFSSCSEVQASLDTKDGGVFSFFLARHAGEGMPREILDKPFLSLEDIYRPVEESVMNYSADVTPRLYWGSQLPDIPFVKNVQYAPLEYNLEQYLVCILKQLWNNGNERELRIKDIDHLCGKGAYGNHTKLSYTPWDLAETLMGPKRRRLTERGRQFVRGEISVPKRIIFNPEVDDFVASVGSPMVDINSAD